MAKMCSNFVAADAKVIFNFALDSVIRKVKETTHEYSLFKKMFTKVESITETSVCCRSCSDGYYTL